jgi:hypothetical protein
LPGRSVRLDPGGAPQRETIPIRPRNASFNSSPPAWWRSPARRSRRSGGCRAKKASRYTTARIRGDRDHLAGPGMQTIRRKPPPARRDRHGLARCAGRTEAEGLEPPSGCPRLFPWASVRLQGRGRASEANCLARGRPRVGKRGTSGRARRVASPRESLRTCQNARLRKWKHSKAQPSRSNPLWMSPRRS